MPRSPARRVVPLARGGDSGICLESMAPLSGEHDASDYYSCTHASRTGFAHIPAPTAPGTATNYRGTITFDR